MLVVLVEKLFIYGTSKANQNDESVKLTRCTALLFSFIIQLYFTGTGIAFISRGHIDSNSDSDYSSEQEGSVNYE